MPFDLAAHTRPIHYGWPGGQVVVVKMTMPVSLAQVAVMVVTRHSASHTNPRGAFRVVIMESCPEKPFTQNTVCKVLEECVPQGLECEGVEGFQHMPPPNRPLQHTNYFKFKAIEH